MNDKTGLISLMTHYGGRYSSELGLQSLYIFPARARRIRIFRIGKPEYKKDVKHDKNWGIILGKSPETSPSTFKLLNI